jgi:hypothetical protein
LQFPAAKVAQKHETKEERVKKSLKSFVVSHILCTFTLFCFEFGMQRLEVWAGSV